MQIDFSTCLYDAGWLFDMFVWCRLTFRHVCMMQIDFSTCLYDADWLFDMFEWCRLTVAVWVATVQRTMPLVWSFSHFQHRFCAIWVGADRLTSDLLRRSLSPQRHKQHRYARAASVKRDMRHPPTDHYSLPEAVNDVSTPRSQSEHQNRAVVQRNGPRFLRRKRGNESSSDGTSRAEQLRWGSTLRCGWFKTWFILVSCVQLPPSPLPGFQVWGGKCIFRGERFLFLLHV